MMMHGSGSGHRDTGGSTDAVLGPNTHFLERDIPKVQHPRRRRQRPVHVLLREVKQLHGLEHVLELARVVEAAHGDAAAAAKVAKVLGAAFGGEAGIRKYLVEDVIVAANKRRRCVVGQRGGRP